MSFSITDWLINKVGNWLMKEEPPRRAYLCDFNQICREVRPADVLLVEGRTRASRIIRQVTQSPWTHAALYIGHFHQIKDIHLQERLQKSVVDATKKQFIIESEMGMGTVVSPLENYKDDHVRILRPRGLTQDDAEKIIQYVINRLGKQYDFRHLLDLGRFLFPWGLYPRRWRSSLFQHNALQPTKDICSSMIAEAFRSINYPILPLVIEDKNKHLELIQRNSNLYTPSDFDYSPYFDIIKYPIFPLGKPGSYNELPWKQGAISDDDGSKMIYIQQKK